MEERFDTFVLSDDPHAVSVDDVHAELTKQYWCVGIPRDVVARSIAHSMVFSIHDDRPARRLVAFARVITDRATFAYLCDVFVVESHRGQGLSKRLVAFILAHPDLQGLRRFCLMTRDAHGVYQPFGFGPMPDPSRYLERRNDKEYAPGPGVV